MERIASHLPEDSNMFLLKGDRNVLIDTGTGGSSGFVIGQIGRSLAGSPLDLVIFTHCHVDHVGGLADILAEFSSEAFALPPDSDAIREADPTYTLHELFGIHLEPQPVTDLRDGQVIDIGQHKLRIISTPGHTSGGICIYDEVGCDLYSGDTVFAGGVGRTDFPGGSMIKLKESLERISNIDIRGLYPGHGDCSKQYGPDYVKRGLRQVGDLI